LIRNDGHKLSKKEWRTERETMKTKRDREREKRQGKRKKFRFPQIFKEGMENRKRKDEK
jgi:hypothetical protein